MSRILGLETSGTICSVALLADGEVIQKVCETPRQHMQHLLPFVDALLEEAGVKLPQLDAIAFSRGPGSFTGLRIAAAAAQGLAYGADLPVVPVSTLQTLAQTAYRETGYEHVLAVLDARMNEVYSAPFALQDGLMSAMDSEQLSSRARVAGDRAWAAQSERVLGAGSGWTLHAEFSEEVQAATGELRPDLQALARDVCVLSAAALQRGGGLAPVEAQPVYIRDKVADIPKSRQVGKPA